MEADAVTVLWARHGENGANVTHTLSHRSCDPDLTERGVAQADRLGRRLAARLPAPGAIVCSPLHRARQTADLAARRLGLAVAAVLEDLRELDVGSLDGRDDADAWAEYDAVLVAWGAGDLARRFPGGEDGAELVARVRRALHRAAGFATPAAPCLVVAHGGNLRAALPHLTTSPPPEHDLPLGGVAGFRVGPADRIDVAAWDLPS